MSRIDKPGRKPYREDQYTVIIFIDGRRPVKYRKVQLARPEVFRRFLSYLDRTFPAWKAVNVYGGLSKGFVNQINLRNRGEISFFVCR